MRLNIPRLIFYILGLGLSFFVFGWYAILGVIFVVSFLIATDELYLDK